MRGEFDLSLIHILGLVRIELTTSALSVLRSNRLSYSPASRPIYTLGLGAPGERLIPEFRGDGLTGRSEQGAVFTPQKCRALGEPSDQRVHANVTEHPFGGSYLSHSNGVVEASSHHGSSNRVGRSTGHVVAKDSEGCGGDIRVVG